MTRKKDFVKIVNSYIHGFSKKHKIEFDYWVGDYVGEIAVFGDYFFNFDDIRWDIDNNVPEKKIFEWYDLTLNMAFSNKPSMNFRTFLKTNL